MREELSREEVHSATDRIIESLLEGAQVTAPPVDAVAVARHHLSLEVGPDRRRPQRGRRRDSLQPEPTEEQRQWEAAHRIGEALKPALLQQLDIDPSQTRALAGESLAKLFANHFLVPTAWLTDAGRACGYDLLDLKEQFATASHEVIAWRLLDLPEPCIITIVDNGEIYRRKSNSRQVRKVLAPAERQCLARVGQFSRPAFVRSGGWSVQGWPIHQADWKREVLRSVPDEDREGGDEGDE
jgi:hypothetical protein